MRLCHKIMYDIDRHGKKKFGKSILLGKRTQEKFYKHFEQKQGRTNNRRGWMEVVWA